MRATTLTVLLSLALSGAAFAQNTSTGEAAPVKAVSFDDVLNLVKAGTSPGEILENCDTVFVLTPEERAVLTTAGASAALIDRLQVKRLMIADVTDIVIILDCSGSMQDEIGRGQTKMDAAKKVVGDLFGPNGIPDGKNVAFIIYGHDASLKCEAVKVVRPLGAITDEARKGLTRVVAALKPSGHTPIAKALRAAGGELAKAKALSQLVLITDGVETCHGDPAKEAEALVRQVKGLRAVEVIGLGLKTPDEKKGVGKIARDGGGRFYDPDNADRLRKALAKSVGAPKLDEPPIGEEPKAANGELTAIDKVLIKQLKDSDAKLRKAAAEKLAERAVKLGQTGRKAVVDALAERVADGTWLPHPGVPTFNDDTPYDYWRLPKERERTGSKEAAFQALRRLAPDRVEAALLKAISSETYRVRQWAVLRLDGHKGESVILALAQALKDEDSRVRYEAAESLGRRGKEARIAADALVERVADSVWQPHPGVPTFNDDIRYDGRKKEPGSKDAALQALKKVAPGKVEDALAKALEAKESRVREWATTQLSP